MNHKHNVLIICISVLVLLLSACGTTNAPATEDNPIPEDSAEVQAQNLGSVRCHAPEFGWSWCLGLQYGDGFGHPSSNQERQEVKFLQIELFWQGFDPGYADGLFGRQTLEAVKRAQRAYGLPVTGLVKMCTWTALLHGYNYLGSYCRG